MKKCTWAIVLYAAIPLIFHQCVLGQIADPLLCSTQGDPVAAAPFNLVDALCIPPTNPIGTPDDVATIAGSGTFRTNANGQLDVFIIWEPNQFGTSPGEQFTYSSSLAWTADKPGAVYKEWVGNFTLPDGPQAFLITDSSNLDLTPPQLLLNETTGTVTDRTIPHEAFPPVPLGRYHIQVTGLDPFVDVTFNKSGLGAHVVPESPSPLADRPRGRFLNPRSLEISTSGLEWNPTVSNDGLTLYFISDRSGGEGAWDMFQASRTSLDEDFGNVVNLGAGVNSVSDDFNGNLSTDGLTLYFSSDRGGGLGAEDLYQATRTVTSEPFGNVVSLGDAVNSPKTDGSPFVSADGLTLYFMSDQQDGVDIFTASRSSVTDDFGAASLIGEVSSGVPDFRPSVSTDGLTMVFSDSLEQPRDGGQGNADIWIASRAATTDPFGEPANLSELWPGSSINSSADEIAPFLSPNWPAAGSKLYYVSDRSRFGDIYEVTWVPGLFGDLDGDGILELDDIHALSTAILNDSSLSHFDLNESGNVDISDLHFWVEELRGTYLGDADLNGEVDFPDFLILSTNFGQSGGWADGDFDASGDVGFPDFLLVSQNFGKTSNAITVVPEPSSRWILMFALTAAALLCRRHPQDFRSVGDVTGIV